MEMTDLEKRIYNTYLRTSRSKQNLPYKIRKDFSDFEKSDFYFYVKKLSIFFNKFDKIDIQDFFVAPYEIYPDNTNYDLHFYITPKAIKAYSLFNKKRDDDPIETHEEKIKNTLFYIYKFCKENSISLNDYLNHRTNNINTFILHLQSRQVSIYVLLLLQDFDSKISEHEPDMLNFILGENFYEKKLDTFRTRLYNSIKIKNIISQGLMHINNQLTKP